MNQKGKWVFTSESVTEGHPDKLCDQIADAVLDDILRKDPLARVACEVTACTGLIHVMGEITTSCYVDIPAIVRSVVESVGYNDSRIGLDYNSCGIITSITGQSPDIARGVDVFGAGDQGMMFGFATDETPEFMPLPIVLAHRLTKKLADTRRYGDLDNLRPDGKAQVSVVYLGDKPVRVSTIVVSAQHDPEVAESVFRERIIKHVIKPCMPVQYLDEDTKIYVNPTGSFVIGGPQADSGLTGRKIIVDTYGGFSRHGGGSFSGKDPTKVDRSGAYAMRHIAKNIVAAGIAKKCEIQVAYAIGVPKPVSIMVDTFGTSQWKDETIASIIPDIWDLSPQGIITRFNLRSPIYRQTACYGHFGRLDLDLPWERLDAMDAVCNALSGGF